jgi:hypothetical protein
MNILRTLIKVNPVGEWGIVRKALRREKKSIPFFKKRMKKTDKPSVKEEIER